MVEKIRVHHAHTLRDVLTSRGQTERIAAVWYLYSEANEPLGQLYRGESNAVPEVGARLTDAGRWEGSEIAQVRELAPTCAMRRFRVVIRAE